MKTRVIPSCVSAPIWFRADTPVRPYNVLSCREISGAIMSMYRADRLSAMCPRFDSSDTDIPFHIGRQDGEAVPQWITAVWREASPAEPIPIRTTTPKAVELFPLQFRADTPVRPYIVIGIWSTRPNQVNKRCCVSGVWQVDSYVRHRNFYNRHRKN